MLLPLVCWGCCHAYPTYKIGFINAYVSDGGIVTILTHYLFEKIKYFTQIQWTTSPYNDLQPIEMNISNST